jgi:hypothetical protein
VEGRPIFRIFLRRQGPKVSNRDVPVGVVDALYESKHPSEGGLRRCESREIRRED